MMYYQNKKAVLPSYRQQNTTKKAASCYLLWLFMFLLSSSLFGQNVYVLQPDGDCNPYPAGYVHCNPANPTAIVEVTNPVTGKTWMDRNLGASRRAFDLDDAESYGSLFQWGRFADGHQCVNRYAGDGVTTSGTRTTIASTSSPGHGDFIEIPTFPFNWLNPQDGNLWQGVNGINNPCPSGFRIPTFQEMSDEIDSWSTITREGAMERIYLPSAGDRTPNGTISSLGAGGKYWTSSVDPNDPNKMLGLSFSFNPPMFISPIPGSSRGLGYSVRCIKD